MHAWIDWSEINQYWLFCNFRYTRLLIFQHSLIEKQCGTLKLWRLTSCSINLSLRILCNFNFRVHSLLHHLFVPNSTDFSKWKCLLNSSSHYSLYFFCKSFQHVHFKFWSKFCLQLYYSLLTIIIGLQERA